MNKSADPSLSVLHSSSAADAVIHADRLTHFYGSFCAIDQLSLTVPPGSVFAMLGRNGSGKSTFIRILLGLVTPTRGSVTLLGHDSQHLPTELRARVGYAAENHPLIDWMRVRDLRAFQKRMYMRWNEPLFRAVCEHFALPASARASQLSRGQRAGLALALVLATEPQVLIMDDPALGLDPVARRTLLEAMILVNRDAGHTIFFTSHELDDVERVADHIAILDCSVLRVACPVEVFRTRVRQFVLRFRVSPPNLADFPGILEARREGNELRLTVANYSDATDAALQALSPLSLRDVPLSLEDAVIAYLGERGERSSLLQKTRDLTGSDASSNRAHAANGSTSNHSNHSHGSPS